MVNHLMVLVDQMLMPVMGDTGVMGYGVGGYGGGNAGYGGPVGAHPSGVNSGFLGGKLGALNSPWGGQSPGYGSLGYGPNVGYGSNVSAPSQSATRASGYGSQAYGYGNYGSNDGYNPNPGGYGAVAGRFGPGGAASGDQQRTGGGYNRQTDYSNAACRLVKRSFSMNHDIVCNRSWLMISMAEIQ